MPSQVFFSSNKISSVAISNIVSNYVICLVTKGHCKRLDLTIETLILSPLEKFPPYKKRNNLLKKVFVPVKASPSLMMSNFS